MTNVKILPSRKAGTQWTQTDKATHEVWAILSYKYPAASAIMHYLAANVENHNAVVISQQTIADILGMSLSTVKRAVKILKSGNWIEIRQIGATGSACAYVLNDRVCWIKSRDARRYSLFSALVVVSEEEQPDRDELGRQHPLVRLPTMFAGEQQLPTGEGLAPPSSPSIPGLEVDLPAIRREQ